MGFVSGFTGGVTLTLSLAYFSILAHQRNRTEQALSLRAQALALQELIDPLPAPLHPSRSQIAAAQRETAVEIAKDRWNEEIESAARWVQQTDWVEVREVLEARVARLWTWAFGKTAEEVGRASEQLAPTVEKTKAKVEEAGSVISSAAKDAFARAKEEGGRLEGRLERKALDARLAGSRRATELEERAAEKLRQTKATLSSTLERGKDQMREVTDVNAVVRQAASKTAGATNLEASNPVAKALQQRYQPPEAKTSRTVAEALRERYTPIDQRDNTILRGL